MPTKLNGYNLSDDTINLMRSILKKSIQTKAESGFALCADQKDNLHARNVCTGETCTVNIEGKCGNEEKFAGTYHTHPRSHSFASVGDLIHCGVVPNVCIGGEADNKIRCHTWKHNHITKEGYNDLVDKLNRGIRKIDDPLHEKNFECMKELGPIKHIENLTREGDEKVDILFSLIRMAEQEDTPKHTIDKMKESMEPLLDKRSKVVSEIHKSLSELMPKYYKENILEE